MQFVALILNTLLGGALDKWLTYKNSHEQRQLDAMNDTQRAIYQADQAERSGRIEVRKATAGFWEMRLLTFLIAFPFVYHLWSIWLDTQFKLGWSIDKFPKPFDEWEGAILLSFFGITVIGSGMRALSVALTYLGKNRK